MKKVIFSLFLAVLSIAAFADASYPWTNPTYIPSAIAPAASLSAPGTFAITTQNVNTVTVSVSGTCTALAATPQISVDGTNFFPVNAYPVTAGTTGGTSTAATSISAAGLYRFNTSGAQSFRLNVTALTAACSFAGAGTGASFTNLE